MDTGGKIESNLTIEAEDRGENFDGRLIKYGAAFQHPIGILGASSFIGTCLLRLLAPNNQVFAFSRRDLRPIDDKIHWQQLPVAGNTSAGQIRKVPLWICVAPIWALPEYFELLESNGVQRIVVLSSTSRFSKHDSSDPKEQALATRFGEAERIFQDWAESRHIEWIIIRPTLIYGFGQDRNITEIARFIRRFRFFPLLGKANGLRQPIHAEDVATVCIAALQAPCAANQAYNISGGETLRYCDMVERIFLAFGLPPRFLRVPLWTFRFTVALVRHLPRYRSWSAAMAERMNKDLVFDHVEASRDLRFKPRGFILKQTDMA